VTNGEESEGRVRPTIAVISRAPVAGRCKTRLAKTIGDTAAAEISRAMLLDTLHAIAAVADVETSPRLVVMAAPEDDGVAVLKALVSPPLASPRWEIVAQAGEGLGARLRHAFVTLGERGGPVALVDADSPTAPFRIVPAALAQLRGSGHACMGPCVDGGYWLIALGAVCTHDLGILEGIAWSTSSVAAETRERCRALGLALDELPLAADIDEPLDLQRLSEVLRTHPELAPRTAAALGRL
jgi:rSAM/selenodomain-associated transferase 1